MIVDCRKCQKSFDLPFKTSGKIEYSRCENVFKVSYRFKTSCPNCKAILQLSPKGNQAIGIPQEHNKDEKTAFYEADTNEETPTVVTPKKETKGSSVVSKFLITESDDLQVRKPLHVQLKPEPKFTLPVRKILFVGIISFSTILTGYMTSLILQEPKQVKPAVQLPPPIPSPIPTQVPKESESAKAEEPDKAFYVKNLDKITSPYGDRIDPIDFDERFHHGLDIKAEMRSEVPAAMEGRVKFVGPFGGYGNIVIIEHPDGYETRYGHLTKSLVKKGAKVQKGDLIGLAGSTGRSTGPHVHFELRKDGKPIDPYRVELMSKVNRPS